jgi:2-succinyl-5-enolpyruvyl-6-hydroxy-3-cyclohexene-1-carboxylate synthase
VQLNVSFRDPLGPEPHPGDLTASSPLALEGRGERPLSAVAAGQPAAEEPLLDELADRMGDSPRGLIVCGRQPDERLAGPVAALAAAAGYPILAEPTSQLRLGGHDRDLLVWPYDWIARLRPAELEPEVVIRFGDMPTSKALRLWLGALPGLRQVVIDPAFGWNDPTDAAETIVRAEPASVANALSRRVRRGAADWRDRWVAAGRRAAAAIDSELGSIAEPTEPGAHAALARLYGDGDLVYTASSMPIRDQEGFVPDGPARVRFLCNRGVNGIDGLISSGLGAAVASGRPTWIVTGDLGLFHDMNGLAALRDAEGLVRVVVLNNDGGGIFEFLPQAAQIERDEFEALLGTPLGIDAARVAATHGVSHTRVEALGELAAACGETGLIEIPVDRQRNVELHEQVATRVAEALGARRDA